MKIKDHVLKAILKVGYAVAMIGTNTTCPWINYQPIEPKSIAKLRMQKEIRSRNQK